MTFKFTYPQYTKEKFDKFVLFKFFDSEEHRNYFLNGKLYMRSQSDFAKNEIGDGRQDIMESVEYYISQQEDDMFIDGRFEKQGDQIKLKFVERKNKNECNSEFKSFISYPKDNQKRNLFCMYTLWFDSATDKHNEIFKDTLRNFGEYGIVITDTEIFLKRVSNALAKEPTALNSFCGFVDYVPKKNIMKMNPFLKTEDYAQQNEFRICVETDNTNLLELPVAGGFYDIAIPIRLDKFITSIKCNEGNITFTAERI